MNLMLIGRLKEREREREREKESGVLKKTWMDCVKEKGESDVV